MEQKFTGKERDSETGLDYFGARYMSSTQGRFTSVDPIIIKRDRLFDPQRINLYPYTRNNPLKYLDPNGADLILAEGLKPKQHDFIVNNLARLYMTEKGRRDIERADRSPFTVELGKGKLERKELNPVEQGGVKFGGTVVITGGLTKYESVKEKSGDEYLRASGPAGLESFKPIQVLIDKSNSSDIGKDPARVEEHELTHVLNVTDRAERPDQYGNLGLKINGIDPKQDEKDAQQAEKDVGKLPDKPSPEAIRAVEEILKPRKKE